MHDTPGGADLQEFITCAACQSGADMNVVYGCITWQSKRNANGTYDLAKPIEMLDEPPSDFWNAIQAWNDYAANKGDDFYLFD